MGRYLGRATDLARRGKFLVHYWRAQGVIGAGREFRAFLDLGRRTESLGWPTAVGLVLSTSALVILAQDSTLVATSPLGTGIAHVGGWLWDTASSQVQLIVGGGVLVVMLLISETLSRVRPLRRYLWRWLTAVEKWIYRKAADL